jgi:uridine kinase
VSEAHASLLRRLGAAIVALHPERIVRVAIDGIDGAEKQRWRMRWRRS